jgi:hypothetical protein
MNEKKSETDDRNEKYTAQIVVETPRGRRNRYKFDPSTGRMKLSKVMPEGMVFPYDFGFFPGTTAEDGDPLDVNYQRVRQIDFSVLGHAEPEKARRLPENAEASFRQPKQPRRA